MLTDCIQVLEKKRLEDREKLQEMEQIRRDKEKFESIIQKLQGMCTLSLIFR